MIFERFNEIWDELKASAKDKQLIILKQKINNELNARMAQFLGKHGMEENDKRREKP